MHTPATSKASAVVADGTVEGVEGTKALICEALLSSQFALGPDWGWEQVSALDWGGEAATGWDQGSLGRGEAELPCPGHEALKYMASG